MCFFQFKILKNFSAFFCRNFFVYKRINQKLLMGILKNQAFSFILCTLEVVKILSSTDDDGWLNFNELIKYNLQLSWCEIIQLTSLFFISLTFNVQWCTKLFYLFHEILVKIKKQMASHYWNWNFINFCYCLRSSNYCNSFISYHCQSHNKINNISNSSLIKRSRFGD